MMRAKRLMKAKPTKETKKEPEKPIRMQKGGISALNLLENTESQKLGAYILGPRASVDTNLPILNEDEREFFRLVKSGIVSKVDAFLGYFPRFNINCQNYEGYTALIIATKLEDIDMVKCLLRYDNLIIGDAVLHAVSTGNRQLVETLINDRTENSSCPRYKEESKGYSADFSSDITPLILAAQLEHYDIIRLLLRRGHRIEAPHMPNCFCKEKCKNRVRGETLDQSLARLNIYKAISSPAYICQTSADPIYTAFMLGKELREIAEIEREFKSAYLRVAERCSDFAVSLLDETRTSEEVESILHRKEGNIRAKIHQAWRFTRIGLAIELEEKRFVAHNNSQQIMRTAWLEGWQDWKRLNFVTKMARLVPRTVLLPLMALIYLTLPGVGFVKTWRAPLNKFFSFASSYIMFLLVILAQNHMDSYRPERGPPKTGLEWFIALYVIGLTWRVLKIIWTYGISWYLRQKWNLYDMVTIICFNAAILCWFWSFIDVQKNGNEHTPRELWNQYDPTLIAECFYALAISLAFGKLFYFFQIGQALGPLLTSLSRMFMDIIYFLALFAVTMFSFSIGLFQIYHHYSGNVKTVDGQEIRQEKAFDTIPRALHTLYWSIYGYTPPIMAEVVVPQSIEVIDNKTVTVQHHHGVTEAVGYTVYLMYYVTGVVILINLLIAMMSTSYSNVESNRDVEWKFSRTKVWMIFFQPGHTLPPPFNIIPSPKTFWTSLCWLKEKCSCGDSAKCSLVRCCYIERTSETEYEDERAYDQLMTRLVQRYIAHRNSEGDEDRGGDSEQLCAQVRSLRHTVRHLQEHLSHPSTPYQTTAAGKTPNLYEHEVFLKPSPRMRIPPVAETPTNATQQAQQGGLSARPRSTNTDSMGTSPRAVTDINQGWLTAQPRHADKETTQPQHAWHSTQPRNANRNANSEPFQAVESGTDSDQLEESGSSSESEQSDESEVNEYGSESYAE